jgi:hypothetical protein
MIGGRSHQPPQPLLARGAYNGPMPIRFTCPHCHQKLSVAQRKAGSTADCPRCQRTLTIPQPPPDPIVQRPADHFEAAAPAATAKPDIVAPPAGQSPTFLPDAEEFSGLELVYDTTATDDLPTAPPPVADFIVVPRKFVYFLGGLLAVVTLVAFAIGMLLGSTFVAPRPPATQACHITGNITYASGPRSRPDVGATIILLPQTRQQPAEKVPIAGLRPSDPAPSADAKGLAIIREMGGGYARTDADGRFQLNLPSRGRYLLLVLSRDKRSRAGGEAKNSDLRKLSPFFDNVSGLIGDRTYRLTTETISGDREIAVSIDK